MKKIIIISILLVLTIFSFGQKFMIKNGDTLLYKEEMRVNDGDTTYLGACWTFEKINGQIINQSDNKCHAQGFWIIKDSLGNSWKGDYQDGKRTGTWKQFDKFDKLLKEKETITINKDTYTLKEVDYSSGQPVILVDKPFLAFYLKNLLLITIILFVSFFSRIFINHRIYNIENGETVSINNFKHNLLCTYSFWFSNYKPENRKLVLITNTLSIISLVLFFGIILALAITGEI